MTRRKASRRSLTEFIMAQRRAGCVMCKLSPELRQQMRDAGRRKRVPLSVILEWMRVDQGVTITEEQHKAHYAARHERA